MTNKQIAFLQALGIACYIALFAASVYTLQTWSITRDIVISKPQ